MQQKQVVKNFKKNNLGRFPYSSKIIRNNQFFIENKCTLMVALLNVFNVFQFIFHLQHILGFHFGIKHTSGNHAVIMNGKKYNHRRSSNKYQKQNNCTTLCSSISEINVRNFKLTWEHLVDIELFLFDFFFFLKVVKT